MGLENRLYQHGGFLRKPPILRRAKRSGGLDFSKPPLGYVNERTKSACPATFFFFPRRAGQAYLWYCFSFPALLLHFDILSQWIQGTVDDRQQ